MSHGWQSLPADQALHEDLAPEVADRVRVQVLYRRFWPADLHMVGKDILRFHAVYWPAFLLAAGLEPPKRVYAHGWWTNEGQKISKSLGNVIDPHDLVEKYGLDPVRYFLLREVPFGNDGDFSHRAMVGRLNNDLANDLGNLAQRVLSMIHKNCAAAMPVCGELTSEDQALAESLAQLPDVLRGNFDQQSFHRALEAIWDVIGQANRYVDEQAPWRAAAACSINSELQRPPGDSHIWTAG